MDILGIDIGGSAIKGAVVTAETGQQVSEYLQIATPQPATPQAVVEVTCELIRLFDWHGSVGCGFPAVIQAGVVKTAANIDATWIGVDIREYLQRKCGCFCTVINDADAAGIAEVCFGAGRDRPGSILVLTLGTGIGSALFYRGELFPNLELGHLPLMGSPAEHYAAASVRKKQKLSWEAWSKRLNKFLAQVERLFSPELIVIGGGVSSRHELFFPYLEVEAELVPAQLLNQAGVVGAAAHAASKLYD